MKIDFFSDITENFKIDLNYPTVDRFMVRVLWFHFVAFVILAIANSFFKLAEFAPSPFGWRVISSQAAILTILLAFVATIAPTLLIDKIKNHYVWRILITCSLVLYSYIFVFISGGAIEMHFHFFIVAALLVMYADWRLGWIVLVITGIHHGVLNYFEPGWVYFYGRNDFAVLTHAIWVFVAVLFTTTLCKIAIKNVKTLLSAKNDLSIRVDERTKELVKAKNHLEFLVADSSSKIQKLNEGLKKEVESHTSDLNTKVSELQNVNSMMIVRELKMLELKDEIEILKRKTIT